MASFAYKINIGNGGNAGENEMANLSIVARIETKEDKVELVKAELLKLIEPTRAEEGCLQYDLHQDNNNPNVFFFYENWTSKELLDKHLANTHIAEYSRAVEGSVTSFIINELTLIG